MTWRHYRSILQPPFLAAVLIPAVLAFSSATVNPVWGLGANKRFILSLPGILLVFGGLFLMMQTIKLLDRTGLGTLAPWDPTKKLVVAGPYRFVRNPMISGVICILSGESLFYGSVPVLIWTLIFILGNLIYIPFWEEPGLEKRFGADYLRYKENVPRWIPRFTPWNL